MSEANIALLKRDWAAYDIGDEQAFAACLTPDWKEYGSPKFARHMQWQSAWAATNKSQAK